ncbi:hypothetical protein B296_00047982 [Ensete ventricosum]|uniref:Major facilitator superfamily (MFS) profile domain-containing protein n=1 Tax=Ensete ventricosum TaxID=4639 RepID=A0A426YWZ8_ENSVE|nr:hypothetical protein B296_00047982 [Ensete ventricosum]
MTPSAAFAAKGGVSGLQLPGRGNRVSAGFCVVGKRTAGSNKLWMPDRGFCGGSPRLGSSIGFGVEMARMRSGMEGIFRSREKARYVRVQATGSFFPHRLLSLFIFFVVNGALEYLARDLAIVENTVGQVLYFFSLAGWVVSTLLAGATVGSFTGGALADKFGRTRTFQLDVIPLAVGAFLRWRTMFSIAIVPSVLMALGMAFCPESPRWLFQSSLVAFSNSIPFSVLQQGKLFQAETAIKKLYGKEKVTEVMHDLRAGVEGTTETDAGWFDLFSKRYWKVVSVGAALFLFQQLAGINAVVYYSTSVFRSAGIASDVAASALVSNFVIGLYFLSVVNKFGISRVYLAFATVCLLAVLYITGNVVETKGRSLEEIERALSTAV